MSVKVYSTSSCPWCDKAKGYLQQQGVDFEAIDVGADRAAAMEMVRKTQQMGVPVVEIGENFIVGFDKPAIDKALQEQGLL
ncbi:MAG: glutathione S-transferase N-terminal domain-containing protein [Synergistales bacterium]|nr:glutathione S-transferase N-terminal domain-containing protein [Synergistales bacterium]